MVSVEVRVLGGVASAVDHQHCCEVQLTVMATRAGYWPSKIGDS
jgi:hypothetical protein